MMNKPLTVAEYQAVLRQDLAAFIQRCFYELNPQATLLWNWHLEVLAAKLAAVRQGRIKRLIVNVPPRHLKSLCASIALPAFWLGHDPSTQILCVSYAQDLSDKLSRDCRTVVSAAWYQVSKKGNQIVERWTRTILVDRQRNLSKAHPRVRARLTERNSVAKGARLPSKISRSFTHGKRHAKRPHNRPGACL
jgi:hypothetical protein